MFKHARVLSIPIALTAMLELALTPGDAPVGPSALGAWAFGATACAAPARATASDSTAKGINSFGADLYLTLDKSQPGEDLFFSPASVSTALAMTYAGARGDTATEMAKVLRFDREGAALHQGYGALIKQLNARARTGGNTLSVANALWGERTYKFLPSFLGLIGRSYGGNLTKLSFKTDAEGSRKRINAWVERATAKKIKDLLKPGLLDDQTRLVLTNAVYFLGKWERPFKKRETQDSAFHTEGGGKVTVPMMYQKATFPYAQGAGLQILELPYRGRQLSMVVLLPARGKNLASLEAKLSAAWLDEQLAGLRSTEVDVYLPRWKSTLATSLARVLGSMGMRSAFSQNLADFTGMSGPVPPRDRLFISAVVHKAFVSVDEQGTEAAAATAVIMAVGGAAPSRIPEFRADRPFLYLIRDKPSGAILFMGRLHQPK